MALTTTQLNTLRTYINADPVLSAFPLTGDGAYEIAIRLNQDATPVFTVWKTSVPTKDVGQAINSTELSGLTTANTSRLQVLEQFSGGSFNPSRADTRAGFDSIFSGAGGTLTRTALLALWKRSAKVIEKVLATGTGTDATPATLTFEGDISYQVISDLRSS
mgnify:CR=1 FL=1